MGLGLSFNIGLELVGRSHFWPNSKVVMSKDLQPNLFNSPFQVSILIPFYSITLFLFS